MDRDFRKTLDAVIAEITPQPWDWTDPTGATLTVIPDGLKAFPGDAEVFLRVTAGKDLAARIGIPSRDMPDLIAALQAGEEWEYETFLDDEISLTSALGDVGGWVVAVSEHVYDHDKGEGYDVPAAIHLPEAQRLPLASALGRALDVARGWED